MNKVAVIKLPPSYPSGEYYHPSVRYEEYPFQETAPCGKNFVYEGVREALYQLQYDIKNFGAQNWNPFETLVCPGETVLVKPNMVKESHIDKPSEFDYVITHGAVLRAICDYVIIALKGKGSIIFADAPETDSDFDLICIRNGLKNIVAFYKKKLPAIKIRVLDLRKEKWLKKDGVIVKRWKLQGDPLGYSVIPLNERSEFIGHDCNKDYFGATFDKKETQRHHSDPIHEYLISNSILEADVIINVPKLKTHKKSGITSCLKNMVGINGDKNWLPHHTEGVSVTGGDQFPGDHLKARLELRIFGSIKILANISPSVAKLLSRVKKIGRIFFGKTEEVVRSGNWYGNDTVWRMILDLNKIVFFFDKDKKVKKTPKKMFCMVDAVFAGDGIGPLQPDLKKAGLLIGGTDPVAIDMVCAKVMGFDYRKIPSIKKAFEIRELSFTLSEPNNVQIVSNVDNLRGEIGSIYIESDMFFKPHFGWKNHIELESNSLAERR